MNSFKAAYINSQCCNHFSIHTAHTVSLAANSRRAGSQLELHPLQRSPPTRQHAPLNRRFTGGIRSHSTRRFVPGIAQHYVRLRAHNDVSKYQIRPAIPASFTARGSVGAEYWR